MEKQRGLGCVRSEINAGKLSCVTETARKAKTPPHHSPPLVSEICVMAKQRERECVSVWNLDALELKKGHQHNQLKQIALARACSDIRHVSPTDT